MWYGTTAHADGYAKLRAGNQSARIEVFDAAGAIVETTQRDPGRRDNANTLGGV
jgi:hypothetical protein